MYLLINTGISYNQHRGKMLDKIMAILAITIFTAGLLVLLVYAI